MANSITSVVELKARQDELPDAHKPVLSLDDLLYVIHGVGSDRDTVWTLEEFRNFIQSKFNDIVMNGTGTSVEVKPGVIEVASENFTVEIDTTSGGGIIFKSGNPLVEKGSIRVDPQTGGIVITADNIKPSVASMLFIESSMVDSNHAYTYGGTEYDTEAEALAVPSKTIVNNAADDVHLKFNGVSLGPNTNVQMHVIMPVGYSVVLIPIGAQLNSVTHKYFTYYTNVGGIDKNLYTT